MPECIDCENYSGMGCICLKGKVSILANLPCADFQSKQPKQPNPKTRQFDSGATRDTDIGKLDYEGFLSPIVLQRYAQYLHKHRTQSDGQLRDSDNWQNMFGEKHFDICMKSACRHFIDWWLQHRKIKTENELEDSICAIIFNAMAYLYKIEYEKRNSKN